MNIYSNGKIYKLTCFSTGNMYIGSTTQSLKSRLSQHEYDFRTWMNGKKAYLSSFGIIANDEYTIELVENYPCNTSAELHKREAYHILEYKKNNHFVCNKSIPGRTIQEYRNDNP